MPDVFSKAKRSEVMSRVRSGGNKDTELRLITIFRAHAVIGWRRNRPHFGKPDFVFPKERVAVFVDGCFWHGCPVHGRRPKQNQEFWAKKLDRNIARDRLVTRTLRDLNWRVIRVWEHDLKDSGRVAARVRKALLTERGGLTR